MGADYGSLAPKRVLAGKPGGCLYRDGMGPQTSKILKVVEFTDCLRR